jgi:hypothetical protein
MCEYGNKTIVQLRPHLHYRAKDFGFAKVSGFDWNLSFRICGVYTKAVTRKLSDSSVYTQTEFSGDRGG